MYDMNELLLLIGYVPDEQLEPPDTQNGAECYLANGLRIESLAREKKKRSSQSSKNLTVRFLDLHYPKLDSNKTLAMRQIKRVICNHYKSYLKRVDTKECLVNECIPFLSQDFSVLKNLTVRFSPNHYEITLAENVSKCKQILNAQIGSEQFYVPTCAKKRFSDSQYFFKSNPGHKINMCHPDKMFFNLSILAFLCELKVLLANNTELADVCKKICAEICWSLLRNPINAANTPAWFAEFLLDNGYVRHEELFLPPNDEYSGREVQLYSTISHTNAVLLVSFVYGDVSLNALQSLEYYSNTPFISIPSKLEDFALSLLHHLVSNIQDQIEEQKHRKKLEGMVARAYTTKRNIPQKILWEMEHSHLNQYFGFIEFDEDVDLSLVDSITQEFIKLNRNVFHGYICKEASLRFRKLGRHHASGLYYPSISTMVVDIRCPSSFIHEWFHLIDDLLNDLSLQYDFSKIVALYQSLLDKKIAEENAKGVELVSKNGKYNLAYYKRKAEIFARCGEIYLFRILKIESSLLKPTETEYFCYPDDPKLNALIEEYYSCLLTRLGSLSAKEGNSHEETICVADY